MADSTTPPPSHDRAVRLIGVGRLGLAEQVCQELLAADERDVTARQLLGMIAQQRGRIDEAVAIFEDALALQPGTVGLICSIARARRVQGRPAEALDRFDEALAFAPDHRPAREGRIEVLLTLNRLAEARTELDALIAASDGEESAETAYLNAEVCRRLGEPEAGLPLLEKHLARPRLKPMFRRKLLFARARIAEARGKPDLAFETYVDAKATGHPTQFDPATWTSRTDRVITTFTADRMAARPSAGRRGSDMLFVVGAPLGGSATLEQVLGAHPDVAWLERDDAIPRLIERLETKGGFPESIDEIDADTITAWSDEVMAAARASAGDSARVLVDGHAGNLRFVGIIAQILPEARVVCCRRDPVETALSCFATPLSPIACPWAANLRDIGIALRESARLVAHWEATRPLAMHAFDLEQLHRDPADEIGRLLDFCGLPRHDACTRAYQAACAITDGSVAEEIGTTPRGRPAAFSRHLDVLRRALAGETVGWTSAADGT